MDIVAEYKNGRRDFSGLDLSGSDLSYCDLSSSDLSHCDLSGSDLSYSVLKGSDLSYCDLSGSDLRGSNLRGSNLSYSVLRGSNLRGSILSYSVLRGSNLSGSDLRETGIIRVYSSYEVTLYPDGRMAYGCETHHKDEWPFIVDELCRDREPERADEFREEIFSFLNLFNVLTTKRG